VRPTITNGGGQVLNDGSHVLEFVMPAGHGPSREFYIEAGSVLSAPSVMH